MRILHAMNMISSIPGIMHQMESEQEAARVLGLEWRSRIFCAFDSAPGIYVRWNGDSANRFKFKAAYYKWLKSEIENIDILLLRYTPYDPLQFELLKSIKVPVFLVMHTKYVEELASGPGLMAKAKALAESAIGPGAIRRSNGLIAVTPEIGHHEAKRAKFEGNCLLYPNGISYHGKGDLPDRRNHEIPEIAFVASNFAPWHGLDLLLKSLSSCVESFRLHLVGKISPDLLRLAEADPRCVVHGLLSSEAVAEVLSSCWIGLSSLAHYRLGMKQACPLKTREYLSLGIPVYASYDEIFPEPVRFFNKGAANMNEIVKYALRAREYQRMDVSIDAQRFIDKEVLLRKLAADIDSRTNNIRLSHGKR